MGNKIVYWKDGKIVREKPVDDSALQNYDKSHKLLLIEDTRQFLGYGYVVNNQAPESPHNLEYTYQGHNQ